MFLSQKQPFLSETLMFLSQKQSFLSETLMFLSQKVTLFGIWVRANIIICICDEANIIIVCDIGYMGES